MVIRSIYTYPFIKKNQLLNSNYLPHMPAHPPNRCAPTKSAKLAQSILKQHVRRRVGPNQLHPSPLPSSWRDLMLSMWCRNSTLPSPTPGGIQSHTVSAWDLTTSKDKGKQQGTKERRSKCQRRLGSVDHSKLKFPGFHHL